MAPHGLTRTLRQAVRRAKHASYRLATAIDTLTHRSDGRLMPPAHLRIYYYGTSKPEVFARACDVVRAELMAADLRPDHRVLDIGSGIGNLAIALLDFLHGGYDGLEIHPDAVAWCQRAITPAHPGFRFHRADVTSAAYNPDGGSAAARYRFPFPDGSFDVVFLGSVFTHMLPDEVANYLHEIGRVLAPGGRCIASFFLINDDTRTGIDERRSFMSFPVTHPSGCARLHDAAIPEAAVAFEESFVLRCCAQAGLRVGGIRRGGWSTGVTNDQDVVTLHRAGLAAPAPLERAPQAFLKPHDRLVAEQRFRF